MMTDIEIAQSVKPVHIGEIAKNAGFCFGVDRAVNSVYGLIEEKKTHKIYTLGNLIHNPTISEDLEKKGVGVISEEELDGIVTRIAKEIDRDYISHLRACKAGTEITVTAELTEVDGRRLEYNVKVEDKDGLIGEGSHQRFVIDPERFMSKLK